MMRNLCLWGRERESSSEQRIRILLSRFLFFPTSVVHGISRKSSKQPNRVDLRASLSFSCLLAIPVCVCPLPTITDSEWGVEKGKGNERIKTSSASRRRVRKIAWLTASLGLCRLSPLFLVPKIASSVEKVREKVCGARVGKKWKAVAIVNSDWLTESCRASHSGTLFPLVCKSLGALLPKLELEELAAFLWQQQQQLPPWLAT